MNCFFSPKTKSPYHLQGHSSVPKHTCCSIQIVFELFWAASCLQLPGKTNGVDDCILQGLTDSSHTTTVQYECAAHAVLLNSFTACEHIPLKVAMVVVSNNLSQHDSQATTGQTPRYATFNSTKVLICGYPGDDIKALAKSIEDEGGKVLTKVYRGACPHVIVCGTVVDPTWKVCLWTLGRYIRRCSTCLLQPLLAGLVYERCGSSTISLQKQQQHLGRLLLTAV